jgi:tetratricopeptide (TPR) repeat protein
LQQEARDKVYRDRIQRGPEEYSTKKLGAFGFNLVAVACFFETPWSRVSPAFNEVEQAWLLNAAAFRLRALGRLTEALEPMRAGLEIRIKLERWKAAALSAGNLSELSLMLGDVDGAVRDAEQAVTYADLSGNAFNQKTRRARVADAMHQAGRWAEAEMRFREVEALHAEHQPSNPLLFSLSGFHYCDLLLTAAERGAWLTLLGSHTGTEAQVQHRIAIAMTGHAVQNLYTAVATDVAVCRTVTERATQTLNWTEQYNGSLLNIALDHLTLGRAALYGALLECANGRGTPAQTSPSLSLLQSAELQRALTAAATLLNAAVDGLRRAGTTHHIPRGLLTRSWLRRLTGATTTAEHGPDSAQSDLDEAWEIAERGPMPLFMADIHLHRARLFFGVKPYPWESPRNDLAKARALIVRHGYWRRKEELEDTEAAAKHW